MLHSQVSRRQWLNDMAGIELGSGGLQINTTWLLRCIRRSRRWAQAKRDKNCKGDEKAQRDRRGGLCLEQLRWAAAESPSEAGCGVKEGGRDGV